MTIVLSTTDSEGNAHRREVSKKEARMSILISDMIKGDDDDSIEIPFPKVSEVQLDRVVQFMKHHCENPMAEIAKPIQSSDMFEIVSEWDAVFVDLPLDEIMRSALVADFFKIPSYVSLLCVKLATIVRDKSHDEVRRIFNLPKQTSDRIEGAWMEAMTFELALSAQEETGLRRRRKPS